MISLIIENHEAVTISAPSKSVDLSSAALKKEQQNAARHVDGSRNGYIIIYSHGFLRRGG